MSPRATVLVPTYNHGPLLLRSVGSVLSQTVEDLEVFVVGDGVTESTREAVTELLARDRRVRFFDNPKGPRHGEIYRHAALAEARSEAVFYLSDDDLWLPEHVESLLPFLEEADFVGANHVVVGGDGEIRPKSTNLALPYYRNLMLSKARGVNRVPLSDGAHTLKMYRRLPHGWRTTPKESSTDLYMWQQFLSHPECRTASAARPTVIQFPSPERREWSLEERTGELDRWLRKMSEPGWRESFYGEVLERALRSRADIMAGDREKIATLKGRLKAKQRRVERLRKRNTRLESRLKSITESPSWRLVSGLKRIISRVPGRRRAR